MITLLTFDFKQSIFFSHRNWINLF